MSRNKKAYPTEEKRKEALQRFQLIGITILILLITTTLVIILRLHQGKLVLPSGESYYNLRIATALSSDITINQAPIPEQNYEPNPYHYVFALLMKIIPVQQLIIYFPIVLGLLTALLFFKVLENLGVSYKEAAYS